MPPESTTSLRAAQVMDRAAALMNDPARTDYTYDAVLPYLNMALDELMQELEESNNSPANKTSTAIVVSAGTNKLTPMEDAELPHYPFDLIEIQAIAERNSGTTDSFLPLTRTEFITTYPATSSLLFWCWEDQYIKFNPNGATTDRDVEIRYVRQPIQLAQNENSLIGTIGSRLYLAYKTASFCSMFIGENPTRAEALENLAQKSLDRMLTIGNKGRQQIMTRHRPFRAAYKARRWV